MNRITSIVLVIVLSLVIGCALHSPISIPSYTYEGKFDPEVFMEWEVITGEQYMDDGILYTMFIYANPDLNSPIIEIVAVFIASDGWTLVSYGYTYEGFDHVFVLNIDKGHYKLFDKFPHEYKGESV